MPQMSPLSWLILFSFFIIIFLFFNIMNFFSFNYLMKNYDSTKKSLTFNWKW